MLIYHKSGILQTKYAIDEEAKTVYLDAYTIPVSDEKPQQVKYTFDEIKNIEKTAKEITPEINMVKKIFPGEIVNYEKHNL